MIKILKKFASLILIFSLTGMANAEIRKLSDSELKATKAQSGIIEAFDEASENLFFSQNTGSSGLHASINDVSKSFDILVSDRNGKWERSGNSTYENGVIKLDETIYTKGITYDNIRLKGADADAKSFGSIHIGEARYEIKGQIRVTFRPD